MPIPSPSTVPSESAENGAILPAFDSTRSCEKIIDIGEGLVTYAPPASTISYSPLRNPLTACSTATTAEEHAASTV